MKREPLNYATPQPDCKRKWSWSKTIWGSLFVISSIAILWMAAVFVSVLNGPWPVVAVLGWPYLSILAGAFLVLAVIALFEFFGAKKR